MRVVGVAALMAGLVLSSALAFATPAPQVVPSLYPSADGQALQVLAPPNWQLVDTLNIPHNDGSNGHIGHGSVYTYRDMDGHEHRVTVKFCGGGE